MLFLLTCPVKPHCLFGWSGELLAKANRLFNHFVVIGEAKHHPGQRYLFANDIWPTPLGYLRSERLKLIWPAVFDQSFRPEMLDNHSTTGVIIVGSPQAEFIAISTVPTCSMSHKVFHAIMLER